MGGFCFTPIDDDDDDPPPRLNIPPSNSRWQKRLVLYILIFFHFSVFDYFPFSRLIKSPFFQLIK